MAISTAGLNAMAAGISDLASLTLKAYDGVTVLDSQSVTYTIPSGGVTDIATNVTFTLTAGETVETIKLFTSTTELATETLTTDNTFPNGGDLIVTSYKITVT